MIAELVRSPEMNTKRGRSRFAWRSAKRSSASSSAHDLSRCCIPSCGSASCMNVYPPAHSPCGPSAARPATCRPRAYQRPAVGARTTACRQNQRRAAALGTRTRAARRRRDADPRPCRPGASSPRGHELSRRRDACSASAAGAASARADGELGRSDVGERTVGRRGEVATPPLSFVEGAVTRVRGRGWARRRPRQHPRRGRRN